MRGAHFCYGDRLTFKVCCGVDSTAYHDGITTTGPVHLKKGDRLLSFHTGHFRRESVDGAPEKIYLACFPGFTGDVDIVQNYEFSTDAEFFDKPRISRGFGATVHILEAGETAPGIDAYLDAFIAGKCCCAAGHHSGYRTCSFTLRKDLVLELEVSCCQATYEDSCDEDFACWFECHVMLLLIRGLLWTVNRGTYPLLPFGH